jgi:hypothetical protein
MQHQLQHQPLLLLALLQLLQLLQHQPASNLLLKKKSRCKAAFFISAVLLT